MVALIIAFTMNSTKFESYSCRKNVKNKWFNYKSRLERCIRGGISIKKDDIHTLMVSVDGSTRLCGILKISNQWYIVNDFQLGNSHTNSVYSNSCW